MVTGRDGSETHFHLVLDLRAFILHQNEYKHVFPFSALAVWDFLSFFFSKRPVNQDDSLVQGDTKMVF